MWRLGALAVVLLALTHLQPLAAADKTITLRITAECNDMAYGEV